jgi:hypothetical protein
VFDILKNKNIKNEISQNINLTKIMSLEATEKIGEFKGNY